MSSGEAKKTAKKSTTAKKPATKPASKSAAKKAKTAKDKKPAYEVGTLHSIPLSKLEGAVNQLRLGEFSTSYYSALADSMKENGYQPIDVYRKDGRFHISDGFTRYEAYRRTRQKEIQCIIIAPEKALANALHKAMMRNDLTALERAEAFQRYMDESEQKKTASDLAKEFRKSPTNISQILSVLRLPEGMRNFIKGKPFTLRDLLQLVEQENNPDEQWALCNDIDKKRKELKEEKIQFGSDIHADDSDDEDTDAAERRSEDENPDSSSTEKPEKSGTGKGRKKGFAALEDRVKDVFKRIDSMLKIEEPTSRKGPKKEILTQEQKEALKAQLEEIIKKLDAPVEMPTEEESGNVTDETPAEPETASDTPDAPDSPKDEE